MKTIYVLTTKSFGASSRALAFECEHCAQVQAAWFRRVSVQAEVIAVQLHEHMRAAIRAKDPNVCPASPGKPGKNENQCGHAPVTVQG